MKKEILLVFVTLFLISLVSSATVVQVEKPPVEEKASTFSFLAFLKSPIFWMIVVGFLLFALFLVGMFFIIRWIISFIKKRNDVFYLLRAERQYLAKLHRSYPSSHWWKTDKNAPIRLVRNIGGKLHISNPLGFHRGDYYTNEGNLVITLNLVGDKHWYIFPRTSMLIIPDKDKIKYFTKDEKGKPKENEITNIPRARDIVQFNDNEILLHAESVTLMGHFLIPVLRSKDGKLIDMAFPVYESMKEVVTEQYLYDLTDSYGKLSKKGMELNPDIRAKIKVQDNNTNVEVPHQ
jgi:hypothetical protein